MAYDLARAMNVLPDRVRPGHRGHPLPNPSTAAYCDLMSAVVVNAERLDQMKFTDRSFTCPPCVRLYRMGKRRSSRSWIP